MNTRQKLPTVLIAIVVISVVLVLGYVLSYFRLVSVELASDDAGYRRANYESGGRAAEIAFYPIHVVDRWLRHARWTGPLDPTPLAPAREELPVLPQSYDQHIKAGSLLHIREDFDGAIAEFTKAIEVNPQGFDAYINRGVAHQDKGEWQLAIDDYEKARELAPNDYAAWNNNAWLLATCPDDSIRDGLYAVELAKRACDLTDWKDWSATSTLAAAYAEFGDFPAAVAMQEKTIELAPPQAKDSLQPDLQLYKSGNPKRIRPLELMSPDPALSYDARHANSHAALHGGCFALVKC